MKDNQVEELERIKAMTGRTVVSAKEAAPACGFCEEGIRWQAKDDRDHGLEPGRSLGFRCSIARGRVNVNKASLIKFLEGGDGFAVD